MNRSPNAALSASSDAGKLVLRVALGLLILLHGIAKVKGGVGPIEVMLGKMNLPAALAYGVYIGELLAPILLIVGVWTRLAALIVFVNMLFAVALAHMGQLFTLGPQGGWALELQGMFLFGALAVALLGAGRYSVGGLGGRFN
ncbi:DoxX family protein [Roseateles violae]|uniref:DoxX family protein n=1 Tax=Roseateles violae TaxID=3058042 RepID=A0ABT8DYK4_9BURK|nr:DoxX family protein [Pelomonas sp. PFR6]MDN3922670.1 DoxX family protein [Pelomonas sp. PFR6]